jgi:hypothetical protein
LALAPALFCLSATSAVPKLAELKV